MTPFDACPSALSSTHVTDSGYAPSEVEVLSDEAAIRRLYELAAHGANDSPEFARLDALVYERLMDTYERGGGTTGITHPGSNRAA